jgi:hypothetical protein
MKMTKHTKHGSDAFNRGIDYDFQLQKKTAEIRRSGGTQEHLLLNKPAAQSRREGRMENFINKAFQAIDLCDFGDTALTRNENEIVGAMLGRNRKKTKLFSTLATNPLGRTYFFDVMLTEIAPIHADPDVAMYFATIVDEDWLRPEGCLTFDTNSMMRRGKRALMDIGYHGILILEIQVLIGVKGVRFMPHMHGVIWRRGKGGMGPQKAAQHLNKRFSGFRKATGVTIALMPQRLPKSLITRFHYATKLPFEANNYCPVKGDPYALTTLEEPKGKMKKAAAQNYANTDALRIYAMLGQHQVDETVFAVGEGTIVRKAASKALTAMLQTQNITTADPSPKAVVKLIGKLLGE